ncbi:formylglycine-generating enzyme family protein [Colwellia sp. TT2012]|uniref:formylglycine-generating enzyme family protein n=1 Tax=Colwellia sp. TT2012 TaxID=1720342 RepID=UPI000709A49D|nr:SUMF1/EgtB/PvdO family nonheme iron enzyme [Colwellia sp. TT2012]
MKKIITTLVIGFTTNLWANSLPIEPVLVPIVEATKNINIQMGKYEVTVEEFTRFVNATDYKMSGKCYLYNAKHVPADGTGTANDKDLTANPFRPIVCIGPYGAMDYASWLAKTTGKPYRLPEKNEWLYASSEGKSSRFAFGDDFNYSEMCDYENIEDAANSAGLKQHHNYRNRISANCNDGAIYHTVVGMYRPNNFGLHDMMGNVREFLQTCHVFNKAEPKQCQEYVLAGSGWHWMPRPTDVFDSMGGNFVGSIEGFRVVLDSSTKHSQSVQTQTFVNNLVVAQQHEKHKHDRLKSLPTRPPGLYAKLGNKNQVSLSWLPSTGESVSYSLYRSYLDPSAKISRKMTKIAEGIKMLYYVDNLPSGSAASYQVFADNEIGQSQASNEVSIGKYPVFHVDERIQAEFYNQYRNTKIFEKEQQQSVLFDGNAGDNMQNQRPFVPSWLKYKFNSEKAGQAMLKMNIRGQKGAIIEFWQGNHLVAKTAIEGGENYAEQSIPAQLMAGDDPIQIRAANKLYFILDWFELRYQ